MPKQKKIPEILSLHIRAKTTRGKKHAPGTTRSSPCIRDPTKTERKKTDGCQLDVKLQIKISIIHTKTKCTANKRTKLKLPPKETTKVIKTRMFEASQTSVFFYS